jgi:Ca-activated chloride channel family protein
MRLESIDTGTKESPMHRARPILSVLMAALIVTSAPGNVLFRDPNDRTEAPYFVVHQQDKVDRFPLKSTSAQVDIVGIIARVRIVQVYANEGTHPIDASYLFPGSSRSAVHAMRMVVGDRVREARIMKKAAAVATFNEAKQAGKGAALLEQQRPNLFQMSIANVMPQDRVQVELEYTELILPTEGLYEVVFPTVVGPRYESPGPRSSQPVADAPRLPQGEAPPYTFALHTTLSAGVPVRELNCPSHRIRSTLTAGTTIIELDPTEKAGGNRDFVLRYRLAGERPQTGMLTYAGKDENFFLLTLQPPRRVAPDAIPPREYIFIVDVSGSMAGFPLETARSLTGILLGQLRREDRFNVLLFAGGSTVLAERSLPATPENIQHARSVITDRQAGGVTALLPALRRGLALPKEDGYSRSMLVITDGFVDIEAEAFDLVRESIGKANLFAFGIGSSVNRHLIEGLARAGQAESFVVTREQDAEAAARAFLTYVSTPVLTDLKLRFTGLDAYAIEPQHLADLMADRPLTIFGKYRGECRGSISISGRRGNQLYGELSAFEPGPKVERNACLRELWARQRIQSLSDQLAVNEREQPQALKEQITQLGLSYNLLTEFTSFVAVDDVVRNPAKKSVAVTQPLPLPAGVNGQSAGINVPAVPEPETWALFIMVGLTLLASLSRQQARNEA